MTDKFFLPTITQLYRQLIQCWNPEKNEGEVFGIPAALFFHPSSHDTFRAVRYGKNLDTLIGVAAGPQTQLAQNIIAAWLCGARYIELKTVQILD